MTCVRDACRYDSTMHPADLPLAQRAAPWQARLDLGFERRAGEGGGTRLVRREHVGPLRVQKPLYPEGADICHALLLHPPAGIAGGDRLEFGIEVGAGAHALLTTPGAGKWYRSAGAEASQVLRMKVSPGGTAEWLPQEAIVFDGALARIENHVELGPGARFIGVDTFCLGRRASGERFARGELAMRTRIDLDGKPLWRERGRLAGGAPLLDSPIGMAGRSVCSTVLAAGVEVDADAMAACRAARPREGDALHGLTAMPGLFVGRYLGHSAEAARAWFVELWKILRPIVAGVPAAVPRIWST